MEYAMKLAEIQTLSENFIRRIAKSQTSIQFKVLLFLKIYGVCTPKILIKKIGIIKTNLAATLKQLMEQGFVVSSASPIDGRGKEFCLTQEGEKEVEKVLLQIESEMDISDNLRELDKALSVVIAVLNRKL